ncbi:MAG: transcriptional repressor LexA [Desulfuromonadaceae bacterium]|nr:transcriptional repressor LexA [Desulfuromonadaceae bacterium]
MTVSAPTTRQQQVYDFIVRYLEQQGYAPTLQEIAAHLKVRGNLGVIRHLRALEKKGFLRRATGSSRGIVLLGRSAGSLTLPLIGSVQAGPLSEALEDIEGYLSVDPSLVRGKDSFVLRVRGDSMIGAQIAPGDLAIVRPQNTADDGDIVVAMLDGEATLKRFFRERDAIRLQPENSRLQPIILRPEDGEIVILGKVTGIVRSLV